MFLLLIVVATLLFTRAAQANSISGCQLQATQGCYFAFQPAREPGELHYFASLRPDQRSGIGQPDSALVVLHGHPRDANRTFNAALAAVESAGVANSTVVIAPVFQVTTGDARKCSTPGVPAAQPGDLLWTCASWMDGGPAENAPRMTSFAAMDALMGEIARRWPSVREITIAGFSAGAQMVQHYVGFAMPDASSHVRVRYVVADPGTWLYFDSVRPVDASTCADDHCRLAQPKPGVRDTCPQLNRWKYGTDGLPPTLNRTAAEARVNYASADIVYLEAANDSGTGKGTYARILDKTCAAQAQGTFRLQRGLAYAAYDRQLIAPGKHRTVVIVPDCAHDVACVFASPSARHALLGPSH
jgi:hypothetical protein